MDVAGRLGEAVGGRYAVERELGRGGMAVVYLARDLRYDRQVAIKVLRPELTVSLVADRFLREIQIAAQLQHPLIVPLYDSGGTADLLWYVMPFVEGETLRQRLQREKQLALEDALGIARDAAAALQCAHEHGFVHRDIKPENILLSGGHALLADFGIARALTRAAGQGTSSGVAIGTPAYMSPEQGSSSADIDARTDIYSLGCVLYEMLAGEPPFTGPTPQAVIARHVSERPPSLRIVRPSIPAGVEQVIERALAKTPADRFTSAGKLADALLDGQSGALRRPLVPRRRMLLWAGSAMLAVAAVVLVVVYRGLVGELHASRYVVAPFLGHDQATGLESHEMWEQELTSALRQVPDIAVVENTLVNDRRMRRPGDASTFDYWVRVARDLRARQLVVPSVVGQGESREIAAEVYDVRSGQAVRRAAVGAGQSGRGGAEISRLAERLFDLPEGVLRVPHSNVEGAQRAFVAGKVALESWNLSLAKTRFKESTTLDPEYAEGHFWLAQTGAWAGDSASDWAAAAHRAVMGAGGLVDDRERALARALLAMAERRFPEACARYDSLAATDSLDFGAWYGLGDCLATDDAVLPDPSSPSGYRFRTGYDGAVRAYERALVVAPSFAFQFRPLTRFRKVLPVEPYTLRYGSSARDTTQTFGAFASLEHDTLAFVPWPFAAVRSGAPGVLSPSVNAAVARNRLRLLGIVRNWARAFPDSSAGFQALTRALELAGALDGSSDVERSALAAARRALAVARAGTDSVPSVLAQVRILVKLGRFTEAQRLGVDALRWWSNADPADVIGLEAVAALLGKTDLTAQLTARAPLSGPGGFPVLFPAAIVRAQRALEGYAAVGAPGDSIAALAGRLDGLLDVGVSPAVAERFRCSEESVSLARAFPELRRATASTSCRMGIPMLEMQWALVNHDTAAVRAAFQRGLAMRQMMLPGDIALDHVFQETWVLLQIGDTAEATAYLDRSLTALSTLRTSLLREAPQAGGLVRIMALRAELATSAGDATVARRWAEAVTILWRDADPGLRPVVERMKRIAELR